MTACCHSLRRCEPAGRCNGQPGGQERDEDEPALPARKEIRQMSIANTRVAISAPCASCLHELVCGWRAAIEKLGGEMYVADDQGLPAGLTLVLSATVDCEAYLPEKKGHKAAPAATDAPKRVMNLSPGQRQAISDRFAAARAVKAKPPSLETVETVD
jgi:hypothetical protein